MLRHACGFALANQGRDARDLQAYLGHRYIQHTVRYTELSSDRFKGWWKDKSLTANGIGGSIDLLASPLMSHVDAILQQVWNFSKHHEQVPTCVHIPPHVVARQVGLNKSERGRWPACAGDWWSG
jgi:hypothetical protein